MTTTGLQAYESKLARKRSWRLSMGLRHLRPDLLALRQQRMSGGIWYPGLAHCYRRAAIIRDTSAVMRLA